MVQEIPSCCTFCMFAATRDLGVQSVLSKFISSSVDVLTFLQI